ncbi:MAG: DUF3097 domain-containing protein [Corynebacterium sp.]|nr:DUF3097 domain-containing protein [Corynebacterium sp.]
MPSKDPYAGDIFGGHKRTQRPQYPQVTAEHGMVVEVRADGFVGAVIGFERTYDGEFVRLEDRYGASRLFKLRAGAFAIDGQIVELKKPVAKGPQTQKYSHSGSARVTHTEAKVAKASRIWVEGVHDAALVEKIWGHDLRVEGIVVEQIEGLDNLPRLLEQFQPGPQRRLGVLADHLIAGTKESRLTQQVGPNVLVTGHPYVDIWQAVHPQRFGMQTWPVIPRDQEWKQGICDHMGWANPQEGWHYIYNAVRDFRDVEPTLIGAVERLIDFVTDFHLRKEDFLLS